MSTRKGLVRLTVEGIRTEFHKALRSNQGTTLSETQALHMMDYAISATLVKVTDKLEQLKAVEDE